MKTALCLLVKDEAPDIAEWILHHLGIGFTAVFAYDNASSDGTSELLQGLAATHPVLRIPWPYPPAPDMQTRCYDHALANLAGAADWVAFLDADEFLIGPEGERIDDLLAPFADAPSVALNWLLFGSNGLWGTPDRLVLEAFTCRAPRDFGPNAHVKSIVRPAKAGACINPHVFSAPSVDIEGRLIDRWVRPGVVPHEAIRHGRWRLHHYFTRSRAHWQRRLQRGGAESAIPNRHEADFFLYDRNEEADTAALHYVPALRRALGRLGLRAGVPAIAPQEQADILLHIDRCHFAAERLLLAGWCFGQGAPAASLELRPATPREAPPLVVTPPWQPSPDVAAVYGPAAAVCRFALAIATPAEARNYDGGTLRGLTAHGLAGPPARLSARA